MTAVSLDQVSKRYAERQVLDRVTLAVDERDRLGVIGRNGSGKSTLLRLVAGVEAPDDGRVVMRSGLRVAYVPQEPDLDPSSGLAGAERREIALLDRMGLAAEVAAGRTLGELSGGQRKRVALARALATEADLLVLDEPTNHLDVDVVDWLEGVLRSRPGALVLVTHDRYLLDRLATRIAEVEDGAVRTGYGSYEDYLEARALREEQAVAAEQRRRNRARTELAWLRRTPAARTSRSRLRTQRAEALVAGGPQAERDELELGMPTRRLGSRVVDLLGVGKRYGDRWVLRGFEQRLAPGARIGVVGPNGSGKTTLLALIAGRLAPDEGTVVIGETVVPGWYGQDPEPLPERQRVLDAVDEVARETVLPGGRRVNAGQLAERFGFPPRLQRSWVGELSGGERRRLELLRVLAGAPNLLLLDEPTNDLDLDTLGVLESYLDTWPGTLVTASHDRYFLDRVCDQVLSLRPAAPPRPRPLSTSGRQPARTRRATGSRRRELAALEQQVDELEERKVALTARLQEAGSDYAVARAAGDELAGVLEALDAAESRWLELAEIGEQ